jgi:hypothetical protein
MSETNISFPSQSTESDGDEIMPHAPNLPPPAEEVPPQPAPAGGPYTMEQLTAELSRAWTTVADRQTEALRTFSESLASFPRSNTYPRGQGPKPKEPTLYDGDRSDGKLDDHVRDLENWIRFHERRNHWGDESEKVEQAATYLTGRMHRMYGLVRDEIVTFPQYIEWLRSTFRDDNENAKLKDDWRQCVQANRGVIEYSTDLLYLAARITPRKVDDEIKEHFRTGLSVRLQLRVAEHPEYETLKLQDYIARVDTLDQIERAKDRVRLQLGGKRTEDVFSITDAPEQAYAVQDPRRSVLAPPNRTSKAGTPSKGTPEWQNYCRLNNACFNCGEMGHMGRNCPQPRETSPKRTPFRPTSRGRGATGRRPPFPSRFRRSPAYGSGKGRA